MKKSKKITVLILSLFIISFSVFLSTPSCSAISSIVDTSGAYANGNYTLADVRSYLLYLMRLILSVVGVLSLLAFIYGGITVLLSAGKSNQVEKGMSAIKAAVIGLIITFSSILIINLFIKTIGASWSVETGAIKSTVTTNK